jgi:hypothetical protein
MTPQEEQGLELAKKGLEQLFEPVKDVMTRLLGPAATEIGLAWGDSLRVWRFERAARLIAKVENIASQMGLKLNPVAPRLLFSILDAASLEVSEELNERWIALLTNATTCSTEVLPSFPDILRQMMPEEARFLDRAYDEVLKDEDEKRRYIKAGNPHLADPITVFCEIRAHTLREAPAIVLEDLERLMLFTRNPGISFGSDGRQTVNMFSPSNHLYVTVLGKTFVRACRVPQSSRATSCKASDRGQ